MSAVCLDKIVGLTRNTSEIFTENLGTSPSSEWYKESTSGLFLDEIPGIPSIKAVEGSLTVQTQLPVFYQQSIETAKQELQDGFVIEMRKRYAQVSKAFIGRAGSNNFSGNLPAAAGYAGVKIATRWIRGSELKIKTVYGMFDTPPTTLYLMRQAIGLSTLELLETIPVTFNAGTLSAVVFSSPKILSMDGYEYFLIYAGAGVVAKNNSVSCGCGSSEVLMKRFLDLVGVQGTDIGSSAYWAQNTNGNGLAVDIEVGCDAGNILCEVYAVDNAYKAVIAHAVMYKSAELVVEKVLASDEINRFTMMSREYLWGKRNHYRKEFLDRLTWMVETLDISSVTDCYACNHGHKKIAKGGILV